MIFYEEPGATIYCGHVLKELASLPANSVDCVMTSPPYWGLRTYKTEPIIWGDNHCEHAWGDDLISKANDSNRGTMEWITGGNPAAKVLGQRVSLGQFCLKCGAWKGELGLEPTIELYIDHLIQIFDEVKRILKKTGTCWVNMGDSYASGTRNMPDYPSKSLCLIPERFALGMVERGWILRNNIIWYKSNPMPESVKDRFTGSWEHLFFFVQDKKYWFEQQFEPVLPASLEREKYGWNGAFRGRYTVPWEGREECKDQSYTNSLGRNKRDVWEINTQPYPEAHFATFPEKLCETPILAGCPSTICKKCGKAREKMLEINVPDFPKAKRAEPYSHGTGKTCLNVSNSNNYKPVVIDKGYTDCGCNAGFEPGTVLDPFCGSGRALAVAKKLGRKAIGIDLSPDYCKMTVKQLQAISIPMKLE